MPAEGVPTWVAAVIAAAAVILGATVTAIASIAAANRKIREVILSHQLQQRVSYLENARAYTNSIYVPLSISLNELTSSFQRFRLRREEDPTSDAAVEHLRIGIQHFADVVNDLLDRGAGAFLTTTLEQQLEAFVAFVYNSRTASSTTRTATVSIRLFGFSMEGTIGSEPVIRQVRIMESFPAFGLVGTQILSDTIIAADVSSRDFEREFVTGIARLRILIKEVTLGAQSHG